MMCGATCVDTSTDPANCGACGHACPGGDTCSAGICSSLRIVEVDGGQYHTCGRRANGTVACWGSNALGQLGNGSGMDSLSPVAVAGVSTAASLDVGPVSSCVVRMDHSLACWGDNTNGRLGDGTTMLRPTPTTIGLANVLQVEVGALNACARITSGQLYCWGDNSTGELGDGTTMGPRLSPGAVAAIPDAIDVAVGDDFTCALRASGQVWCWGGNVYGELGSGTTSATPNPTPAPVIGFSDAVEIAARGLHACARRASGQVVCWGDNASGALGTSTAPADRSATPVVAGLPTTAIAEIACGLAHTCARTTTGDVYCWGYNSTGEVGDASYVNRTTPVLVPVGGPSADLDLGNEHTCAARDIGALLCWGNNANGRLGDGTTMNRDLPVLVLGL
jgi:alpha-tubulin suppressor-like RCC1 family protein